MSNLERDPAEVLLEDRAGGDAMGGDAASGLEILQSRDVPLGGPRAMSVRRTLPQRSRSLIGAWCFVDHYGPDDVTRGRGMVVPPHPHTGLQTVSWLFAGEIDHRDSAGSHATVRPGELNLMTAGRGIQHSEVSTPDTTTLHGAQLWIALPDAFRHAEPRFEHFAPVPVAVGDAVLLVFLGSLCGVASPVPTFSPLVGAQVDLPRGSRVRLDLDPAFEHGVLVDAGPITVNGSLVEEGELAFVGRGIRSLEIEVDDVSVEGSARLLLIGGEPLGEQIVMWWNFIGRDHSEIVEFRRAWQEEVVLASAGAGRFGHVDSFDGAPLPAPEMPGVRLKPRG
ncbi:MAG: pirin family protein [Burkholderiaceae bacterium]|nr:pirin family protein [Microbacteriaceae bacterium]